MGAWGAIIMGFFGAMFVALTLHWQLDITGPALAAPFLVFVAIALAATYVLRRPGTGMVASKAAGRVIMWASAGEGIGLFLAANIVINVHRPELLLPAMALIVGLHFLPIAYAAPFPPFYTLGGALIIAAIIGALVPAPLGGVIAGLMAALGLWIAALVALRRDLRVRQASRPA